MTNEHTQLTLIYKLLDKYSKIWNKVERKKYMDVFEYDMEREIFIKIKAFLKLKETQAKNEEVEVKEVETEEVETNDLIKDSEASEILMDWSKELVAKQDRVTKAMLSLKKKISDIKKDAQGTIKEYDKFLSKEKKLLVDWNTLDKRSSVLIQILEGEE